MTETDRTSPAPAAPLAWLLYWLWYGGRYQRVFYAVSCEVEELCRVTCLAG